MPFSGGSRGDGKYPCRAGYDGLGGGGFYHSGELPDQRMRVHARRRGYELTHHSRQVMSYDFERFDVVIGMDDSNISQLRRLARTPEEEQKVRRIAEFFRQYTTWDHIPDPYYTGAEGFETVLDLLQDACHTIADRLEKEHSV